MPTANQKLAEALDALRKLQADGHRVFQSKQFKRLDRERLLQNGFLQEVILGWVISSSPNTREGDSTPWYASFWEFCARYCNARFGAAWCLSPEQSLLILAEHTVVPTQAVVCSPKGTNNKITLPFGTSLYDLKQSPLPPKTDLIIKDGLRLLSNAAALVRVSETFFRHNPIEVRVVLESIRDASEVLARLLEGGHSTVAGRLAGAFRHVNRPGMADEILKTMKSAGFDVRETNPFHREEPLAIPARANPPIVTRLQALWETTRSVVLEVFPSPPGLPADKEAFLKSIDDIYTKDAYNSLSIEGYTVSTELIEQVRSGNWNPDAIDADRKHRDALAARGYWQAFQSVKATVAGILDGTDPAQLVGTSHRDWYRELFQPAAAAGLINITALAGYRNDAVYLRGSRHVPPRWEAVRDAMPALFDLLRNEASPAVRAVLGHWLLGYVHPYPDGNGRIARFLMNAMLSSGGYPWTIIRLEDRGQYLAALESASVKTDIRPFATLLAESMKRPIHRVSSA
jgi:fido (protein-threonine AMPylation protein)